MKNIATTTITLIAVTTLMVTSGCASSFSDMSCSDSIVTDTVIEISRDTIGKQLFRSYLARNGGSVAQLMQTKDKNYPQLLKLSKEGTNDVYTKASGISQKIVNAMHLEAIRLVSKDESTKKISCDANLVAEGKAEISYTAQLTDSGEVYVEVYGLE